MGGKNSSIILVISIVLICFAGIAGVYLLIKSSFSQPATMNTPASTTGNTVNYATPTPRVTPVPISTSDTDIDKAFVSIDAKIKDLDSDQAEIEKAINDTPLPLTQ